MSYLSSKQLFFFVSSHGLSPCTSEERIVMPLYHKDNPISGDLALSTWPNLTLLPSKFSSLYTITLEIELEHHRIFWWGNNKYSPIATTN